MSRKIFCITLILSLVILSGGCDKYSPNSEGDSGGELDLRGSGVVTTINDQGNYKTDWAFAVLQACESNYLMQCAQGVLINNLGTYLDLDLSEMHLAYFAYNSPKKKYSIYNPDSTNILNSGGNLERAVAFLSRGCGFGPVLEGSLPYGTTPGNNMSPEDYSSVLRLTDAEIISVPEWSSEKIDEIKQLLITNGALYLELDFVTDGFNTVNSAYYYPVELTDGESTTNNRHCVNVIGWNDNFSTELFNENNRPIRSGAWLVRDSFGTEWGQNGYFWLSYAQSNLLFAVLTVDDADRNLIHYGYDDLGHCCDFTGAWAANVFPAEDESRNLIEIGYYTLEDLISTDFSIYTYDTLPSSGDIVKGNKIYSVQAGTLYKGYHTIELEESLTIPAGKYFSVVMHVMNPTSNAGKIAAETRIEGDTARAVAFDGQSHFSEDGITWIDGAKMTNDAGERIIMNACIKAFCTKNSNTVPDYSSMPSTIGGLNIYNYSDLRITVSGDALAKFNELNPIDEDNPYKAGRTFSQYIVDDNGNLFPEGTSVDISFTLISDLYQVNTTPVSQYGFKNIGSIIDILYPQGYRPIVYYNIDDIICPVYGSYVAEVDDMGQLNFNVDELLPLDIETHTTLPTGYYRVMYSVGDVIGVLRTIQVTD